MAGAWTTELFPQFEREIRALADRHKELDDEPLHLAVSYLPYRDGQPVYEGYFLLEAIGGMVTRFAEGERELFEAVYEAEPVLPARPGQELHLILTTSEEMDQALNEGWPSALEVADAVRRDDYEVLHQDDEGRVLLERIKRAAMSLAEAARG